MSKGFATNIEKKATRQKKSQPSEPTGRLISWSPWPPANFKTRYPACPFVLTVLILIIGQCYISLIK